MKQIGVYLERSIKLQTSSKNDKEKNGEDTNYQYQELKEDITKAPLDIKIIIWAYNRQF